MGWKEYGKYGVCTGRTVRSPFAHSKRNGSWNPRIDTETLFKLTRGTENLSRYELDEFLCNNDIDDGLGDFNESNFQIASGNVHYCSIFYSLKKRERWSLPEKCSQQLSDLEDRWKYGQNITFIHRKVERKLKADCIAVHKTNRNEVLQSKKHLYAQASDLLRNSNEADVQPEVCYEISYRYPLSSYPVHAEVHRVRDDASWKGPVSKADSKGKGAKNKGARWGFYSDAQIRDQRFLSDEEPVEMCSCKQRRQAFVENKITTISCAQFNNCSNSNEILSTSNPEQIGYYKLILKIEAEKDLSKVRGYNVDFTGQLPLLAKEEQKSVVSAENVVKVVNAFYLATKRLYSEVVSGIPERFTFRKDLGGNDNVTTAVESGDKFGPENVNINKEGILTSLDEMTSTPMVLISKTMNGNVPSDKEVKCSRLPSPPKCPKPARRRCPRVRLRTQENGVLENGHKSSSVSSTGVERRLHSRVLTETPVVRNTKKTHRSILPLKYVPPSLLQPKCIENSLQNLEIVGTKVSVHYHSHCSLPCLSESRNQIVAIKNVRGSSLPRQVSLRHISTGERRIKGACSYQCPENAEQPCINKCTIIGTPRQKALEWHKNVSCTKWILQEPRILSLRPSFLPVLQGRSCGVTVRKEEIHRAQKRSFLERKPLTPSSKHDKRVRLSSQCGKDTSSPNAKELFGEQGITRKRRNSSTLRQNARDNK